MLGETVFVVFQFVSFFHRLYFTSKIIYNFEMKL